MDLQTIEEKEDGWNLIVEAEYSLEKIKNYLKNSCLAEKADFINIIDIENVDYEKIEELCASILAYVNDETSLDELSSLLVVACMLYTLKDASIESLNVCANVLHGVIFGTDTLCPQHLHVFVERIWDGLKIPDDTSYVMNVTSICREISVINSSGKAIAICLAWTILAEITETETEMFCFHKFSEINTMLKEIDEDVLRLEESTQVIYILIQVVGFLINTVVFGANDEFVKSGYGNYFQCKRKDLEQLKEWAENLSNFLGASTAKASNYWDLRFSMTDYIKMNIISVLYDKIREMD